MKNCLVNSSIAWLSIGAVVSVTMAAPHFRFGGLPAHFSFRTVHNPFIQQANTPSSTFFFRKPSVAVPPVTIIQPFEAEAPRKNLVEKTVDPVEFSKVSTLSENVLTKTVEHVQPSIVHNTNSAKRQAVDHVPVMVPVGKDFQGNAVIVTADELSEMGLRGVSDIQLQPSSSSLTLIPEKLALPEAQTISQTVDQQVDNGTGTSATEQGSIVFIISAQTPSPAEHLSATDDSFVLTSRDSSPVDASVLETINETITEPEPIAQPKTIPKDPVVESIAEAPVVELKTKDEIPVAPLAETMAAPISPLETDTFKAYNQFLNTWLQLASVNLNRPDLLNLVNAFPVSSPKRDMNTVVQEESIPVAVMNEENIEEHNQQVQQDQPQEGTQNIENIVEPVTENVVTLDADVVTEPIATNEVKSVPDGVSQTANIAENIIPESEGSLSVSQPLRAVPTFTSRGRHAGFRYSFSHKPQRGTFFLNSVAG